MLRTIRRTARTGCLLLPLTFFAHAQQPDNSGVNKDNRPTADAQRETSADRDLAAKIRKFVMDDKSLSTYAHNVKIIVQSGVVTLKGPVRSRAERESIQAKAEKLTDPSAIRNEMTVAPRKEAK